MQPLYIETKNGRVRIDPAVAKKFNLEMGELSPFTRSRIVGENGEFPPETETERNPRNSGSKEESKNENEALDSRLFTTSEIIDLSHGEDSKEEH